MRPFYDPAGRARKFGAALDDWTATACTFGIACDVY
jgi:hypothetical protein